MQSCSVLCCFLLYKICYRLRVVSAPTIRRKCLDFAYNVQYSKNTDR